MNAKADTSFEGFLGGVRVLEIGDELGEYCGKVLAGLGADVVRVEPPGGEGTRSYGPFYRDQPDPNRSLYFWHYNFGKRGIVLDLDDAADVATFAELAGNADVVIDSRSKGYLAERGLGAEQLRARNPRLVYTRISPFGDDGPWVNWRGSDLIHLALGGVMMNCGYDPDPEGRYDLPPIAPQMWQSYHIAGEIAAMSIIAALTYRQRSGEGQEVSMSVHEAVSKNTETDNPDWIYLRQEHHRLTCRHSMPTANGPALSLTKDGRYLLPYRTYVKTGVTVGAWEGTVELLRRHGMGEGLVQGGQAEPSPADTDRIALQTDSLIGRTLFDRDLWLEAQELNLPWAPIRKPEENIADKHWHLRDTFIDVFHPEFGESFTYTGAKWVTGGMKWRRGPRAPQIGEHTEEVLKEWTGGPLVRPRVHVSERAKVDPTTSAHDKPFALSDIRVVDLGWMLASAGAGRFLSAMGAEVIKVEHVSRPDGMRFAMGVPEGLRPARDEATGPLANGPLSTPNRGAAFMEINAGKLALSLNLKNDRARSILEELIKDADVVLEGYSPGTMNRMGFGYERLKELNPDVIYVQQSGFGELGTYGRARAYGPTAQAITGLSEMSGLPEPHPPAGIGYSYLDWFGAYNMATATFAAIHRRNLTGLGCHIDASQGDTGLYLAGTSILDYSVNGRSWSRYGNRSPYKAAAPHGAYRVDGDDRWIAIAAFEQAEWLGLIEVLGRPDWSGDLKFASLESRLAHVEELDRLLEQETARWDGFDLAERLQAAGTPAGMCQTMQDRMESDPQLAHLDWMVELPQSEIGTWPVREIPVRFSETPTYIGGPVGRSGPNYGEDNAYVLGEILGFSEDEIAGLEADGAL